MKTTRILLFFVLVCFSTNIYSQFNFQRSWGTYFGDERFYFSDSTIDSNGNLYILGTIDGQDTTNLTQFTNNSSFHQNYGGGLTDGFLVKINPLGQIVWGTFLGGENSDKMCGIDIDKQDNLFLIGCTYSLTNISTPNSFQENISGEADYFISKFTPSGSVIWSTYFGGTGPDYDNIELSESRASITFDGLTSFYISSVIFSDNIGTPNVFQENKGSSSCQISKFNVDGTRIWTTYYGVDTWISSIKANANAVYVAGKTIDCPPNHSYNTYYGTPNGFKSIPSNCRELFLSKFSNTGQREWSTYYGGNGGENLANKSLSLKDNKIYLSGSSPNYTSNEITTAGSYQSSCLSASNFIAQFNEDGTRNWGTYNGNIDSNQTNIYPSNVFVDNVGNYYNYGSTIFVDLTSTDAYKTQLSNDYSADSFICKFAINNNRVWGTYYGGEGSETNVRFHNYENGDKFYIAGVTTSLNEITTTGSFQPTKQIFDVTNNNLQSVNNIFITHFEPLPLSNTSFKENLFTIYPNPNNGNFTIKMKNEIIDNYLLELYDVLGKKLKMQTLNSSETKIQTTNLSKGIYIAKITNSENISYTTKIVVE